MNLAKLINSLFENWLSDGCEDENCFWLICKQWQLLPPTTLKEVEEEEAVIVTVKEYANIHIFA